jgi:hypothetical protein
MRIFYLIVILVALIFMMGMTRTPPEPRVYHFDESREAGSEFLVYTEVLDEGGNYSGWDLNIEYVNLPAWLEASDEEVISALNPNDAMIRRTLSGTVPRVETTYEWMARATDKAGNDDNKWSRLEVTPDVTPPSVVKISFGR